MNVSLYIALLVLMALLALVSYVDRLYAEMGKFLSRDFEENIEAYEQHVEPRLKVTRARAALSMAMLSQLCMAGIGLVIGWLLFMDQRWVALDIVQAVVSLVFIIVIFNRLLPYVFFARTRGEWLVHFVLLLRALIWIAMPATLVLGFALSVASLTRERTEEEPETPAEVVDALIEAGQEEGILEESDRDLIHSVVEFGDKTVHEVMTPRPEIVAVPITTTLQEFTELINRYPYSRIPVHEGDLDHIKGIVYAKDLLQLTDEEAATKTVQDIMKTDVCFVPETKLGSDLLREMQRDNVRMAICVDEYGGVSGLLTIEDLVEEIVGEIRDEHEKAEVVKESDTSYVFNGNTDLDLIEKLLGVRPEEKDATTVAGLVSELAGHIPKAGEVFEENGLKFEVLESTERRVDRVRISLEPTPAPNPQQVKA
jgi:CBS domain containing-hemolysin-like protein